MNVTVVGIPAEAMAPLFQFLVEIIRQDVAEQRGKRSALRRAFLPGSIRSFVFRAGLFFFIPLRFCPGAQQFPPSRGVMGARSPHSKSVSLIC